MFSCVFTHTHRHTHTHLLNFLFLFLSALFCLALSGTDSHYINILLSCHFFLTRDMGSLCHGNHVHSLELHNVAAKFKIIFSHKIAAFWCWLILNRDFFFFSDEGTHRNTQPKSTCSCFNAPQQPNVPQKFETLLRDLEILFAFLKSKLFPSSHVYFPKAHFSLLFRSHSRFQCLQRVSLCTACTLFSLFDATSCHLLRATLFFLPPVLRPHTCHPRPSGEPDPLAQAAHKAEVGLLPFTERSLDH